MINKAVIGLGFGDEGKGITTDYLCSNTQNSVVIRYSGGQQAGHTVVVNGIKHVFSNFGSGTLRGVPTYWSKFCTIDPFGIVNELNILLKKGISPLLYIDERCPVTTPFDIYYNQQTEQINQHGSCGVGVGSTLRREEHYYSLTFKDLFYPWVLTTKLNAIKQFYNFKEDVLIDEFLNRVNIVINSPYIKSIFGIPVCCNRIFEGSQGLLLDQHIGFFPNVTRSNTGTKNILEIEDESIEKSIYSTQIYLVTRAYQTRHGNGPITNENIPNNIKINEHETNKPNMYQGSFRRSLLDLDLLEYGINKDEYISQYCNSENLNLVITCLDYVENDYQFTYKGEIISSLNEGEFINKISKILNINNVYISKTNESKNIIKFK
jgi:adenylosuccinate synthase